MISFFGLSKIYGKMKATIVQQEAALKEWKKNYAQQIEKYNLSRKFRIKGENLLFNLGRIDDKEAKIIAEILPSLYFIKSVTFDYTTLDIHSIKTLMEAIRMLPSITTLNFDSVLDKDEIWSAFLHVFKTGTFLTSISFSNCSINSERIRDFFEALDENKSIFSLGLQWNNIESDGIHVLVKGIKKNPSIISIDLSYNDIDLRGINILAQMLKDTNSFTSFNVSHNDIESEKLENLERMFKNNIPHISFILKNDSSDESISDLEESLESIESWKDDKSENFETIKTTHEEDLFQSLSKQKNYGQIHVEMNAFQAFLQENRNIFLYRKANDNALALYNALSLIWKEMLRLHFAEEPVTSNEMHPKDALMEKALLDIMIEKVEKKPLATIQLRTISYAQTGYVEREKDRRALSEKKEEQKNR